jgi:lipopolysaccharide transport system ATP-binding protein
MNRIRSLVDNGTSIIFVSHNFYLVRAVCESALYIDKGIIKHRGDAVDVINAYERDLHEERARRLEIPLREKQEGGGGDIEITRVAVLSADGQARETLPNSRAARIRIDYNAYRGVGKIHASVFIVRSDGLTCCMMRTRQDNFDMSVERGQGSVSVEIEPLQLVGGTYFAEAWLLDDGDSRILTPGGRRSDWFLVKGAALSFSETSGVFEPRTRWTHHHGAMDIAGQNDAMDQLRGPAD